MGVRSERRSWTPALAIAFFTLIVILSFGFAKAQADRAIESARHGAEAEAARADRGICQIAVTNRSNIIAGTEGLLSLIRQPIEAESATRTAARQHAIEELERQLAEARKPFPAPCAEYRLP